MLKDMRTIVQKVLVGGLLACVGAICFTLQLFNTIQTPYPWLVDIAGCMLLLVGIFLLVRAKIAHSEVLAQAIQPNIDTTIAPKGMSLIEKQQQMGQEWEDTTTKRDKLKMLKMASAAQEEE